MNTLKKTSHHPPEWVRNLAKLQGCEVAVVVLNLKHGRVYYYRFRQRAGVETYLVAPDPLIPSYERRRERPKYRQYSLRTTLPQESIIEQVNTWASRV